LRPASANRSQDPISKITRAKWTGGMAQEVENLLYKCKALSSNPIPPKEKKKRNHRYSNNICQQWSKGFTYIILSNL
jgi:hypothetical protein